uniref:inositol-phosphate phosphatase n=1 Tax=Proboscia inermis TaxID=420281 RepID=A0A7S0G9T3_9STRA|mmetsp:Transcript_16170/g.16343  ORF Transcript_16170/g.16343 Transcript_16170/m.16343 type:complete len:506 (+) Transcript_16170:30-1547(+)
MRRQLLTIVYAVSTSAFLSPTHIRPKPFTMISPKASVTTPTASHDATSSEEVVRRYFEGVTQKDPVMLRSCFDDTATILDVCGSNSECTVNSQDMVQRCMEFVGAHPDCSVRFHYGPCRQARDDGDGSEEGEWVVAHWYETGNWSGASCGIPPPNPVQAMECEGQTRFWVSNDKIQRLVVTRTFTDWEREFQRRQSPPPFPELDTNTNDDSSSKRKYDDGAKLKREMLQTAELAARAAGTIITSHVGCQNEGCDLKVNLKDIVTKYDTQAQSAIKHIITSQFPDHVFLGEEDVPAGGEASAKALVDILAANQESYIWIVDPIDGTANFAAGLELCGVTVTVVHRNEAILGVIYDPHRNEMYTALKNMGSYCNGEPIGVAGNLEGAKDAIINAGCPADPNAFATSMRGVVALNSKVRGIRVLACSALTLAWLAQGRLGAHYGYDLSSWDLVAGSLLIREAGGIVTDLDGSEYRVTTRNMLCSANRVIHEEILTVLKEVDATSFQRV